MESVMRTYPKLDDLLAIAEGVRVASGGPKARRTKATKAGRKTTSTVFLKVTREDGVNGVYSEFPDSSNVRSVAWWGDAVMDVEFGPPGIDPHQGSNPNRKQYRYRDVPLEVFVGLLGVKLAGESVGTWMHRNVKGRFEKVVLP